MKTHQNENENRAYIYKFRFVAISTKLNAVFICRKGALNSPLSQTKDGRDLTLSSQSPNPLNFADCKAGSSEVAV